MTKTKFVPSLLLAFALLVAQVGIALAAPGFEDPAPITGTVQSIVLETDANGVTTVLVTVDNGMGGTQTVRISVDTAVSLGLVTLDANGDPLVNDAAIGTSITIDPATVIADEEADLHPVGSALADFFGPLLGVDYDTIMGIHDEGVGFGVIAQALYMANALEGDAALFEAIIDAKTTHDFSGIVLPDGSTVNNWGQLRKALLDKKQNLGQIRSGHAGESSSESTLSNGHGHGKSKEHGNPHE